MQMTAQSIDVPQVKQTQACKWCGDIPPYLMHGNECDICRDKLDNDEGYFDDEGYSDEE